MKSFKTPFLIATVSVLLCTGVSVSSANASQPKSLPAVSSVSGSISNGYNYCLGTGLRNIVNVKCPGQNWTVSKSSRSAGYQIGTKNCVTAAVLRNGENLQLASCGMVPAAQQDWVALPSGGIALVGSNFCLDVEVGVPKPNSPIQIYTCQGLKAGLRIPAQRWAYNPAMFNQSQPIAPVGTTVAPIPPITIAPIPPITAAPVATVDFPTLPPKTRFTIPPITIAPVGTTVAPIPQATIAPVAVDVNATVRRAASQFDPSLPVPSVLKWETYEPFYGTKDQFGLSTMYSCSKEIGGVYGESMVNFSLVRGSEKGFKSSALGTKLRVMNSKRAFLKHIIVLTAPRKSDPNDYTKYSPATCAKFTADSSGWIIISKDCNYCLFFGMHKDDWPKNAVLEVAQISQTGAGRVATVAVSNPKKSGPSRATCNWITTLGGTKAFFKVATKYAASRLPPVVNDLAGGAIDMYFSDIDPLNPIDSSALSVAYWFKDKGDALKFYNALSTQPDGRKYYLSDPVPPVNSKTVKVVMLAETVASAGREILSIKSDYKNVGC